MWEIFSRHLSDTWFGVANTGAIFWENIIGGVSLVGLIDIALVFCLLWWIYRRLRRSDLIKVFPRIFGLVFLMLVARMVGLLALFYVSGFLLVMVLLSLAVLYAPEIRHLLESQMLSHPTQTAPTAVASPVDVQRMIKVLGEALSVLTRAQKSALVVIRKDKPLSRLIENGTKMNSLVRAELLIDFFASGSTLSKGATILDGNRIVAAGSTLFRPHAKILFSANDKSVRLAAKELKAVVVVASRTLGDTTVLYGDDIYKHLAPPDLVRVLQNIFVHAKS
ncbi:MAG: diadenylate cyclase [bacterium]